MAGKIAARVERVRTVVRRATLWPVVVRGGIGFSFAAAYLVAWPAGIALSRYLPVFVIAGLWPAVAPRGRAATLTAVAVVAGWLADTVYRSADVALWRVLAIATLLYLGHTLAALAAQLPYDSLVNGDVVGGWLLRAGVVVLISAVLTVVALGLSDELAGGAFLAATLAGLAAAVGATLLLSRLLRRS